ncbi:MAG: Asp-tRNA(Asn)/Glu-tRNA(Gln) amidotransferase subunit GatC [Candidatus Aenigmarchaeota archaeon]|nr:Asp-tRNA(Asn)/Glu-tRNA(Gln) amidotransferase subunit GatC [Candidatus Aenigmarchaeota archaeon]
MLVSEDVIRRVAKIARLELTNEEVKEFTKQIDDVLEAFKAIEKVDTKNVEPSFQPLEIKNIWRNDEVCEWDWKPLSNAENKEDDYFKGPRAV